MRRRDRRSSPPLRRSERPLRFESFEARHLLDSMGLDGAAAVAEQPVGLPERFASADELSQFLIDQALVEYSSLFGKSTRDWFGPPGTTSSGTGFGTGAAPDSGRDAPEHSETNIQVVGVDEGDIVETDGDHLYVLSGQEVVIVDSWPAGEAEVVSRVRLEGQPFAEFLSGDRLTVLSTTSPSWYSTGPMVRMADAYYGGLPQVQVTVIDIADRLAPRLVQQVKIDGHVVDVRAIENHVYVVLQSEFGLPGPEKIPIDPPEGGVPGGVGGVYPAADRIMPPWWPSDKYYVYETKEQYLERMQGHVLELGLPQCTSFVPDGEAMNDGPLTEATNIYRPASPADTALVTIAVFDTQSDLPGPESSVSMVWDWASNVYASTSSIYLFSDDYGAGSQGTSIRKLDIAAGGGRVELAATGQISGHLLNQFSADEYEGRLRVATTTGWGFGANNHLHVLETSGEQLQNIALLSNIAPGERIYSVRFQGERAYVVTFRQVDPLFAIDLSDPRFPRVAGELVIPGFSHYLHPLAGDYLIGIGMAPDPVDGVGQVPQVSLFDVADLSAPQLLQRFDIDTSDWGFSEAFYDHHAVSYFPEYQVLTLPIHGGGTWTEEDGEPTFTEPRTDVWVFKVHTDDTSEPRTGGFELLGRVEHEMDARRTVRIEDKLYVISDDTVSMHELIDPDIELARIGLKDIVYLEPIDSIELDPVILDENDLWYAIETTRNGPLTLDAGTNGTPSGVVLTLYDTNFNPLVWNTADGQPRLDWLTVANRNYYLRVGHEAPGAGTSVRLKLTNAIEESGTTLHVYGTDGNDRFEFSAVAGITISVNGTPYTPSPDQINAVVFHGGDGRDRLDATGSAGNETLTTHPGTATLIGPGYVVEASGLEVLHAAAGEGGTDVAHLYDSGVNDRLETWPDRATLRGGGQFVRVAGFDQVYAHATGGGRDTAVLHGSPGGDEFRGDAGNRYARLNGNGYLIRARLFEHVEVLGAGGFDQASLWDSAGNDVFSARQYVSRMHRKTAAGTPACEITVRAFDEVHAWATRGGFDRADVYDTIGEDRLEAFQQPGSSRPVARLWTSPTAGDWAALYETVGFERIRAFGNSGTNRRSIQPDVSDRLVLFGTWDE